MKPCIRCRETKPCTAFRTYAARTCSLCAEDRLRRHHRRNLVSRYGITLEDWDTMILAQAGRCAICNAALQQPYIDHCHDTQRVRGLLCSNCNTGLGRLGDNVAGLRRALAYLEAKES
jgi:hypothetical protein